MKYKLTKKITKERINEILKIKEREGLTAETLVSTARNKKSSLHDLFEWNDTIAGEKWRLQQARVLINEIKITINTQDYYAFENIKLDVSEDSIREYKPMQEIMETQEWRDQIIKAAMSNLIYWKSKYSHYNFEEFSNVISEIQKIEDKIVENKPIETKIIINKIKQEA